MAKVLANTPYTALQSAIGGLRLMVSEPGSSTNKTGLRYVGTIFNQKVEQKVDWYEHYETASGGKVVDRKLPKVVGLKVSFQLDDMFAKNWERFLLAGNMSRVAEDLAATHDAETFIAGKTGDHHGISEGRQTDAQLADVTVYNTTDAALLVVDVDYSLIRIYGWTFVKLLVDTHAGDVIRVGTGATAVTDYAYKKLGHDSIAPLTRYEREVAGVLQFPSKTGGNAEHIFAKAILGPDGDFDWNSEQASSIKMALDFKDNSAADAAHPFGEVRHYGYDDSGAAVI